MIAERERTIDCKVSPGMFSNERVVVIELPGGEEVSLFVDKDAVQATQDLKPGNRVIGYLNVFIIGESARGSDYVLIALPGAGMNTTSRIEVPEVLLKQRQRRDDPER